MALTTFYSNYVRLCAEKGKSASGVAREIGLSNAAANGWKNGKEPSDVTLQKLSLYFGVPVSELTEETKKPAPENGDELDETLERLRTRPECRMLFKLADGATAEDVKKAVAIIEALRSTEEK